MCPISEVVDNNPGVIVCGVGLHPNNIATKTVNATTDGNAVLLQRMTTLCHPLHAWEDSPERLPADKGTENGHVEIKVDMMFQLYSRHFEFNVDMLTLKSTCRF